MATADHQQHLGQGTSFAPDSLPMGTDIMAWGQSVARHLLPIKPDRSVVNSMLRDVAGYREERVIEVIGGLLSKIHSEPSPKEPKLWHYQGTAGTGMEARLYGGPNAVIVTTVPHKSRNWEMEPGRQANPAAVDEYSNLYGTEKPPYKFKMVVFDPGPKTEDGQYDLNRLAKASQIDRKLPFFGMQSQDWRWKDRLARWAVVFQAVPDGENDVWVRMNQPDGTKSNERYRFTQREPGKAHVAVRVVNVSPTGW